MTYNDIIQVCLFILFIIKANAQPISSWLAAHWPYNTESTSSSLLILIKWSYFYKQIKQKWLDTFVIQTFTTRMQVTSFYG